MSREKSSQLTFHLSHARWHLRKWQELGSPALHINSNAVFALCSLWMSYDMDHGSFTAEERQHFISNVAVYGYDLGVHLTIDMHPREVAAAHFQGLGAPNYDILVGLGFNPSEPAFWVRYNDSLRASETPEIADTIELPDNFAEP